jgi:hypothetical protein
MLAQLQALGLSLLAKLGEQLPGIVESLAHWGAAFFDWVVEAAPGMIGQLAQLSADLFAWIAERAPDILSQLATWAAQFALWIVGDAIPKLLGAAGQLLSDFTIWIINNAPAIGNKLTEWAVMFGNWVTEKAIPNLITALGELWGRFSGWISETAGKISADGSIGRAIADGVRKGISAGWGALKDFVSQKASELLKAATDALRMNSPSKEFRDKVGVQIPAGIAVGVNAMQGQAVAAVKNLSNKLLKTAADATGKFARSQMSVIDGLEGLVPDAKKLADIDRQIKRNQGIVRDSKNAQERIRAERDLNRLYGDRAKLMQFSNKAAAEIAKIEENARKAMESNPEIATQYYDLRTKQVLEIAGLEKELSEAQGDTERAQIQEKIELARQAHQAENDAFKIAMEEAAQNAEGTLAKTIDDMKGRVADFMRDSFAGIAGLSRQRGQDKRTIADMLVGDADKLKELSDEEARLRITASQNIDAEKRAEAQERLAEIAQERAAIEQRYAAQRAIGLKAQEELKKAEEEAAAIRATDPKLAEEYYNLKSQHILELANLERERTEATSDLQRAAIDEQIALVREAQQAELANFSSEAAKRREEVSSLQSDMTSAVQQFGQDFTTAIRESLEYLASGLQLALSGGGGLAFSAPAVANGIRAGGGNIAVPALSVGTINVDARGSNLTETRIKQLIREALDEAAKSASARIKTR